MTKDAPIALIAQKNSQVLGAMSQDQWWRPNYVFIINHNIATSCEVAMHLYPLIIERKSRPKVCPRLYSHKELTWNWQADSWPAVLFVLCVSSVLPLPWAFLHASPGIELPFPHSPIHSASVILQVQFLNTIFLKNSLIFSTRIWLPQTSHSNGLHIITSILHQLFGNIPSVWAPRAWENVSCICVSSGTVSQAQ